MRAGRSTGGCRWTPPAPGCISTARLLQGRSGRCRRTRGAGSNGKNSLVCRDEPGDHAIGRSRGGLTTKTHALVDGNGLPLVIAGTPGQANDSPALPKLLAELRVPRHGPGRPRTTPQAVRADKAYSPPGASRDVALTAHHRRHPRTLRPDRSPKEQRLTRWPSRQLRRRRLQKPQRRRTGLQPHQELAGPGHPLRQTRPGLPRRRRPRIDRALAVVTDETRPRR